MRLLIALCLLAQVAVGQNTAAPVQTESDVLSLAVSFAGAQRNVYRFKIANRSGHAVTALALRLVPAGIAKVGGRYACGGCSRSLTVADNAQPVIKAGGSVVVPFSVATVNGGAVVAEAAIFDDESYEGEERAAAFLVAAQIGRQAEYDRLIPAIDAVMARTVDDAEKTTQLRTMLSELSVNLDPPMIQTFKRWFPNLASCLKPYARVMKAAATRERRIVADSLERFGHDGVPGMLLLSQWWAGVQEQLATSGCNGCAAYARQPKRPARAQSVNACVTGTAPPLVAALPDDGSDADADELEDPDMDAELSQEDEAALDAEVVPDMGPSTLPASTDLILPRSDPSAAKIDVIAGISRKSPPSGFSWYIAPDGNGLLLGRVNYWHRAVPDYSLYGTFFRDTSSMGDWAFEKEVRWDASGELVEDQGPRAGGLNNAEIAVLKQVAEKTNQQLAVIGAKKETLLRISLEGYPPGWMAFAPPIFGLRELEIKEAQTVNTGIEQLKAKLGAASFARLDGFVRTVYDATPGKMVTLHPYDEAIQRNFFEYLGSLDELAEKNGRAKEEEAKRQAELRAAGLQEKDWTLLVKTARDYAQTFHRLYSMNYASVGLPVGAGVSAYPAGSVARAKTPEQLLDELRRLQKEQQNDGMAGKERVIVGAPVALPAQTMPVPLGEITLTAEARRKEAEQKHDELQLEFLTDTTRLRAGLGEPGFQKLEAYIHRLYAKAGFQVAVPLDEKEAEAELKKMQRK